MSGKAKAEASNSYVRSVLATSSNGLQPSSFLLLIEMPFATSSFLFLLVWVWKDDSSWNHE